MRPPSILYCMIRWTRVGELYYTRTVMEINGRNMGANSTVFCQELNIAEKCQPINCSDHHACSLIRFKVIDASKSIGDLALYNLTICIEEHLNTASQVFLWRTAWLLSGATVLLTALTLILLVGSAQGSRMEGADCYSTHQSRMDHGRDLWDFFSTPFFEGVFLFGLE